MTVIRPSRRLISRGGSWSRNDGRQRCIRLVMYPPVLLVALLLVAMFYIAGRERSLVTTIVDDAKIGGGDYTMESKASIDNDVSAKQDESEQRHQQHGGGIRARPKQQPDTSAAESTDKENIRSPVLPISEGNDSPDNEKEQENDRPTDVSHDSPDDEEEEQQSQSKASQSVEGWPTECALYLAQSTIPNSGLGMFTAIDLAKDAVVGTPDITIPVLDINWHNQDFYQLGGYHLLYENYFWSAGGLGMAGIAENVGVMSHGFGALANSHQGLMNLDEGHPSYDDTGLHRSTDPGAGALSPYHDREAKTTTAVPAGAELFVDYGSSWFTSRAAEIGYIPLEQDYNKADRFLRTYDKFASDKLKGVPNATREDFWNLVRNFKNHSRSLNALPETTKDAGVALKTGIRSFIQEKRSPEWLKEHGKCLDNIRPQPSTIKQAGRGAFATRLIPKDSLVISAPLIHIPRGRDVFQMYEMNATNARGEYVRGDPNPKKRGTQLITNYVYSNPASTVYLSPYGPGVSFINHDADKANVRIQWEDPSNEWLTNSVEWLETKTQSAKLSFDFIATRDIQPGEEVFLNYGNAWEQAWTKHVDNWSPTPDYVGYISASKMNKDVEKHLVLRTSREQDSDPYPSNIQTYCRYRLAKIEKEEKENEEVRIWNKSNANAKLQPCEILSKHTKEDGTYMYDIRILERNGKLGIYGQDAKMPGVPKGQKLVVKAMPRTAIEFADKMYTSDILLSNAFRHEIVVDDDVWPESWKNMKATKKDG